MSKSGSSGQLNYKHYMTAANAGTIPSTLIASGVTVLNNIPQGITLFSRLGTSWHNHHINTRISVKWALNIANAAYEDCAPQPVRYILFLDTMPQVFGPNLATLTLSPSDFTALLITNDGTGQSITTAAHNPITHGLRFKILRDEIIQPENACSPVTLAAGGTIAFNTVASATRSWHTPLGFSSMNSAPTATLPDTNSLYHFVLCDVPTAGAVNFNTVPTYQITDDIFFTDEST